MTLEPGATSEHSAFALVVGRDDYEIRVERLRTGHTCLHADVRRWTPEVRRAFLADLDTFIALHGGSVLVVSPDDDLKMRRFHRLCGFHKEVARSTCHGRPVTILERSHHGD